MKVFSARTDAINYMGRKVMPGIVGDTQDRDSINSMMRAIAYEDWHEHYSFNDDVPALGIVYLGKKDPRGFSIWQKEDRCIIIYGQITNQQKSLEKNIETIYKNPRNALIKFDGSFLLACVDREENRLLVATDKLGSYPCFYYSKGDRLVFASELKAILRQIEKPKVDIEAIVDLLSFDFVLGDKTLVKEVRALRPASFLEWNSGNLSCTEYMCINFDFMVNCKGYVDKLTKLYREAVRSTVDNLDEQTRIGVWLSGGLDSRALACVLKDFSGNFQSITYDSNPVGGNNLKIANKIAHLLKLPNEQIELSEPLEFINSIREGVKFTDGMVSWNNFHNLPYILNKLSKKIDVIILGSGQGELFGDIIHHKGTPEETIYKTLAKKHARSLKRWRAKLNSLINLSTDPVESTQKEIKYCKSTTNRGKILETMYRNFYPNFHFRTKIERRKVGTRSPFPNAKLLDHTAKMPDHYRLRKVSILPSNIPHAVSLLKLELIRHLDKGLDDIEYERTNLPPKYPLILHTIKLMLKVLTRTTKPLVIYDRWIRENPEVYDFIKKLLDNLGRREQFNSQAINQLLNDHMKGINNLGILCPFTTVEIWLEEFIDRHN